MLTLTLEPTDDRANPLFKDAASCKQWLAKLQLTDIKIAQGLLLTEINELNRFPMRGLERLETLELLRDTVNYVQEEYARKLAAKPLPLNELELTVFFAIVQLWQAMSLGYQRCLQEQVAGDKQLAKHVALLCQRAMQYVGLGIFQHLRTGYEIDGKLWRQLHYLYGFVESQQLLSEKVPDPLDKIESRTTCHDSYLKILLMALARPDELSRSQVNMVERWLPEWIDLLTVALSYTASRGDAQPLAFDLDGSQHGLQSARMVKSARSVRYLAMVPLSKLIRVKTILLQQGKTPKQVDLGDWEDSKACIDLLTFLHQCWCEDRDMRLIAREQNHRSTTLFYKLENIYAHLTGKSPQQPTAAKNDAASLERWHVDNENIQGAQLTREGTAGGQLSRNQLVAMPREDKETMALGVATWLRVMRTGQLRIGIRYLPGRVEAINLNATGDDKTEFTRPATAFLLHAVPELGIPPSLIMPRNWFKAGRSVELVNSKGERQTLILGFQVESGSDFTRASFKIV